ncbi:MAG TPA: hypothetical protein VGP06_15140, partial [Janthinobacterium sp.]|nr:hypothetical protein [Janthinobacterium sp.]
MTLPSAAAKLLALGFGLCFIYVAGYYPFEKTVLAPILLAYILLLCWRQDLWLFLIPALLPVLDLAPWTG